LKPISTSAPWESLVSMAMSRQQKNYKGYSLLVVDRSRMNALIRFASSLLIMSVLVSCATPALPTPIAILLSTATLAPTTSVPSPSPDRQSTQKVILETTQTAVIVQKTQAAQAAAAQDKQVISEVTKAAEETQAAVATLAALDALETEIAKTIPEYINPETDAKGWTFIENSFTKHKVKVFHPTGYGNSFIPFEQLGFAIDQSGESAYLMHVRDCTNVNGCKPNEQIGYLTKEGELWLPKNCYSDGIMPVCFQTYYGRDIYVNNKNYETQIIFGRPANPGEVNPNAKGNNTLKLDGYYFDSLKVYYLEGYAQLSSMVKSRNPGEHIANTFLLLAAELQIGKTGTLEDLNNQLFF
jgi:hypothetical protein